MLTCYVAWKYLGHPPRKQNQREPLPHTQAEHLHQQMFPEEAEKGNLQWCVQGVATLHISSTDLPLFLYVFY